MKSEMEKQLQQLRSQATELLFKEDYNQYINLYTHFISTCENNPKNSTDQNKSLLLALSNRAEAHHKVRNFRSAIEDCNKALEINPCHMKSIICKGKSLLELDRYSHASETFQNALFLNKSEAVFELLEKSKKLDAISRSGQIDISDWLIGGCNGKFPDLAEYIGSVEVRKSKNGIRGLFATKNIDLGTTLVITKAVLIERGISPETGCGLPENAKMVMWKGFVDRMLDTIDKCKRTLYLIYLLSTDNGEEEIPDMGLFKPETEEEETFYLGNKKAGIEKVMKVLEVNCLNEEAISSKVIGNRTAIDNRYGVGLWILPSFVNHSCIPNARRIHIGDWLVMHASRNIKVGEEITFAYFDVLLPLNERKELGRRWGFECKCERCEYEEKDETMRDIEKAFSEEYDVEKLILWLEGHMRKNMKKKERGFGRASFWNAYVRVYESEKMMKRLGMRICKELAFGESLIDVIGGDERILRLILERVKKNGSSFDGCRFVEMEKIMKMGKGVYGKLVKKHGLKILFQLLNN